MMPRRHHVIPKRIIAMAAVLAAWFTMVQPFPAHAAGTAIVRLTMIPHRSALGNATAYSRLVKAMETRTGLTIQWVGSQTYAEVARNLKEGRADIGYMGAFAYIKAHDDFGLKLIVRTLDKHHRAFYHSMIITQKDSGITDLASLRGRCFAFTDPGSTSGFLFPMTGLKKAGLGLGDFSKVIYVKRHANSVLAVANGQADAGAVSSTAADKVNVDFNQFTVLWKSKPIYRGPWVAANTMPDRQVAKIRDALIWISNSAQASRIFKDLGTQGFVLGKDSDYDNVREVREFMTGQGQ